MLTPAQWATLMTETAPAAEIPDLIAAAASYVRQETMLRIATKYPPAIALTLAKSLSGSHTSTTDERLAQLSLGAMLQRASDGETVTGEKLVSELVSRRSNRLAAAGKEQVDLVVLERARLDAAITRSTTVMSEEHKARLEAEERASRLEADNALVTRKVITAVVVTAGVALTIILCIIQFWTFAAGTAIATAVFAGQSREWAANREANPWQLAWALVPEALAALADVIFKSV